MHTEIVLAVGVVLLTLFYALIKTMTEEHAKIVEGWVARERDLDRRRKSLKDTTHLECLLEMTETRRALQRR